MLGFGTAAFRVFMGELTGAVLASDALEYAAPELVDPHAGLPRANARSDMYSLAQVACRVLQARVVTTPDGQVKLEPPGGGRGESRRCLRLARAAGARHCSRGPRIAGELAGDALGDRRGLGVRGRTAVGPWRYALPEAGGADRPGRLPSAETAPEEYPPSRDEMASPRDLTQAMMAVVDDEEDVRPDEEAVGGEELPPPPASPLRARECLRGDAFLPRFPTASEPAHPRPATRSSARWPSRSTAWPKCRSPKKGGRAELGPTQELSSGRRRDHPARGAGGVHPVSCTPPARLRDSARNAPRPKPSTTPTRAA